MGEKYQFSFTRGMKSRAQISNYNLSSYYDVYSVVGDKDSVLVKWENGLERGELVYSLEEVNSNLDKGVWVKLK